jgi:uncharacterized protein YndB with AHSA1/START domain
MSPLGEATPDHTPQLPPLKLSRVFRARRETVFSAWSTADHVSRWFAPAGCEVADVKVEMRIGGPFELLMRAPGLEHRLRGTFIEIVANTRLVLDMRISDANDKPLFRAYTELNFTQTYTLLDPSVAGMLGGAPEGWRSTLDNLERELARLEG